MTDPTTPADNLDADEQLIEELREPTLEGIYIRARRAADRLEALRRTVNELETERDAWMRQAGTATGWWRNEQDARKEAEVTLAKVQSLHKPKHGENDRGEYVICDYDGTAWPCRTQVLLDGNGGDTE